MVFESLVSPLQAEKKPWIMLWVGALYSSLAVLLSIFIFRDYASLIMIFFTVLASTHLVYGAVKMEEKKDLQFPDEKFLIKEHGKVLHFLIYLFIGFVVSFSAWYVFLPDDLVGSAFEIQIKEISKVQESHAATGNAINLTVALSAIFLNNLMVMIFSFIFAFMFGVGAIFILTWNASIMGAAIGSFVKNYFAGNLITGLPIGLLRYSIHGIPEMLAYFTAGLGGSIISIAVIRHDFSGKNFKIILKDSFDLVLLSIVILVVAALIEVFITPIFF